MFDTNTITLDQAFALWDGKTTWGHVQVITNWASSPPKIYYRAMTCGINRDDGTEREVEHHNPAVAIALSHMAHKLAVEQLSTT